MNNQRDILHTMFMSVYQLKKDFKHFLSDYPLTEMEAKFIFYIGSGHSKTSELIERFRKHKSTIRQKTRSLEEKGYITVDSAEDDKRERVVLLTKKGASFYSKMKAVEKKYHARVFRDFSEKDELVVAQVSFVCSGRSTRTHELSPANWHQPARPAIDNNNPKPHRVALFFVLPSTPSEQCSRLRVRAV